MTDNEQKAERQKRDIEDGLKQSRMRVLQAIVDEKKKVERFRAGIVRAQEKEQRLRDRLATLDQILGKVA